jgi:hypothetical protein
MFLSWQLAKGSWQFVLYIVAVSVVFVVLSWFVFFRIFYHMV